MFSSEKQDHSPYSGLWEYSGTTYVNHEQRNFSLKTALIFIHSRQDPLLHHHTHAEYLLPQLSLCPQGLIEGLSLSDVISYGVQEGFTTEGHLAWPCCWTNRHRNGARIQGQREHHVWRLDVAGPAHRTKWVVKFSDGIREAAYMFTHYSPFAAWSLIAGGCQANKGISSLKEI